MPDKLASNLSFARVGQLIGKESVVVKKSPENSIAVELPQEKCSHLKSLEQMEIGSQGMLAQLPEHPLLAPLGLRRGKLISIESKQRFGGPVMVETQGRVLAIARSLAEDILVEGGVIRGEVS